MKRLSIVAAVACLALLLSVGVTAALAGGGGGNKTGQTCQQGKWNNLIRATNGTRFTSETECTAWVAKNGTSSVLPLAAQACFNNGYLTKVREDWTTFASQSSCTTYVASGGALYPIAGQSCLVSGWILKNKDDGTAVASGAACITLLNQNKLLGVKLTRSYNAGLNAIDWSLSAFGVDPSDEHDVCVSADTTAWRLFTNFFYTDPWEGGGSGGCSVAIAIPASGEYNASATETCPTGPTNVDDLNVRTGWGRSWTFRGGLASIGVGVSNSPLCVPPTLVNQAPTAVDDQVQYTGSEFDVVANDTDPDGNVLRIAPNSASDPANGSIDYVANNHNLLYTPDNAEVTSDSFTYRVQDRGATSANTATVTITINNGPPATATPTPEPAP